MNDNTQIRTTIRTYPQIYAYTLPDIREDDGWIKIGYTERRNAEDRIKEQTHTAAINLKYSLLWTEPALTNSGKWFVDKELHSYLKRFKGIKQRPNTEWFYYDGTPDKARTDVIDYKNGVFNQAVAGSEYMLRAEQEDAVARTLAYAKEYPNGEFLWNAKPRFGKTLTTYDLMRRMDAKKVLVVTNRPAIANSWFDDFEKFIAWQTDYAFISTTDSLKDRQTLTYEQFMAQIMKGKNRRLAFISLQDLKGSVHFGGDYRKLEWVKNGEWDLLVIDEAHEGVDTFKTDVAFNEIKRNFTLHLSGTPFRAIASGKFNEKQIFNWTYADEQDAKESWDNVEENNPYESLPRLNLFSYQMSQMITDKVNRGAEIDGKEIDFAFDLNEFFATGDNGKFLHEPEIKKWLDTLSSNEKYPFSTDELRSELRHTMWLLNRVDSAKALHKMLKDHPAFTDHEIVLAAGDGRTEDDPVANDNSFNRVREAIKTNERTITLTVRQLTTGVTIPEWTAVLMLSNLKSPSLYMQAAFRSQNPWDYEDENGEKRKKQNAYVFDFAPERTLIIYDEIANNLNAKTADGGGTTEDRENNIRELLNFFPVIAEDKDGKMVELDVKQVLTIPKTIKAQEVVKRGFMSNFLFQNVTGIFASSQVREILEQLNPVPVGKVTPVKTEEHIDTKGVEVDSAGNATVEPEIVINTTEARFGAKVYADIIKAAEDASATPATSLTSEIASVFTNSILDTAKEIAKDNNVTVAQAEQVVRQNANVIAREVEYVQKQSDIKVAEAEVEFDRQIAAAQNNKAAEEAAKVAYEKRQKEIAEELQKKIVETVTEKSKELVKQTTETILQKAEQKKKYDVEDEVRARLRGFARTIPSFLMAYGTTATTLENFDTTINDDVFKEVTGITLEQFRILRDAPNFFFNPIVFNEAILEFQRKREELADYFDESHTEDIFDYIPPQRNNQIYTPKWVVKMMLDKLEEENPDLYADKDKTFADLYVKSGLYLAEIVKRLYAGLESVIPNKETRLKHILEHQVYGFAPSEIIYNIARNFVFGGFPNIDNSHLKCSDLTETAKSGGTLKMKFDAVVGNPPYNEETKDTSDSAIYYVFYDLAERTSQRYCLISPARFLFNAGKTPTVWNEKMLADEHVKILFYEQVSGNVFPNTDIKGGVAVLYRDSNVKFGKIGTFTIFDKLNFIVQKVVNSTGFESIVSSMYVQEKFNLDVLYTDFPNAKSKIGSQGSEKRLTTSIFVTLGIFTEERTSPNDIRILGLVKNIRQYRFIKRKYIEEHPNLEKYKVMIPAANGTGAIGEVLSTPLIGEPLIGYTQSFISIGAFDNEIEAQNCLKYIKSKFARTMLGVLKITQHNQREKWEYVPLQDFTPQSDIDWTQSITDIDRQLYAKYSLDEKEIAFIEDKVKAME